MFITQEMEMKAEKVREKRAIDKAVDAARQKTTSDMIHTMHQNGADAAEISRLLNMKEDQVQSILQPVK